MKRILLSLLMLSTSQVVIADGHHHGYGGHNHYNQQYRGYSYNYPPSYRQQYYNNNINDVWAGIAIGIGAGIIYNSVVQPQPTIIYQQAPPVYYQDSIIWCPSYRRNQPAGAYCP